MYNIHTKYYIYVHTCLNFMHYYISADNSHRHNSQNFELGGLSVLTHGKCQREAVLESCFPEVPRLRQIQNLNFTV